MQTSKTTTIPGARPGRGRALALVGALCAGLGLQACDDSKADGMSASGQPTLAALVAGDSRFTTLDAALKATGLDTVLRDGGPFTVFAPTDSAFGALPNGTLQTLLADPEGKLKPILLYHVVDGTVKAAQVVTLDKATTKQGKDIAITHPGGKVILNGNIQVTQTDILAKNGVVHVINGVLLPPTP